MGCGVVWCGVVPQCGSFSAQGNAVCPAAPAVVIHAGRAVGAVGHCTRLRKALHGVGAGPAWKGTAQRGTRVAVGWAAQARRLWAGLCKLLGGLSVAARKGEIACTHICAGSDGYHKSCPAGWAEMQQGPLPLPAPCLPHSLLGATPPAQAESVLKAAVFAAAVLPARGPALLERATHTLQRMGCRVGSRRGKWA